MARGTYRFTGGLISHREGFVNAIQAKADLLGVDAHIERSGWFWRDYVISFRSDTDEKMLEMAHGLEKLVVEYHVEEG